MLPEDNPLLHPLAAESPSSTNRPDLDQKRLTKEYLLVEVCAAVSSHANLEEALSDIVTRLQDRQMGNRISALLIDHSGQLQVRASVGDEILPAYRALTILHEDIIIRAAAEKAPIISGDVQTGPGNTLSGLAVRSKLAIPLLYRQELIGILLLESVQSNYFDENDRSSLSTLGVTLGGLIANFQLSDQVHQQALYDQQIVETTASIRRSASIQTILETSAREIGQTLGARRVRIRITTNDHDPGREGSHL